MAFKVKPFIILSVCCGNLYHIMKNVKSNKLFRVSGFSDAKFKPILSQKSTLEYLHWIESSYSGPETDDCIASRSSRLPNLNKFMFFYWYILTFVYFLNTIKYILICLIDLEALEAYRWLDCYLPGRNVISTRVTYYTKYYTVYMMFVYLIWIRVLVCHSSKWNFDVLEFMLCSRDFVLRNAAYQRLDEDADFRSTSNSCKYLESLMLVRGQNKSRLNQFILKPNRTLRTLLWFDKFSKYYFATASLIVVVFGSIVSYMLMSAVLTRRGFELNYSNCVSWIKSQPNRVEFSQIYPIRSEAGIKTEDSPTFILPFVDLVDFNWYHSMRILMDILDMILIWVSLGLYIASYVYIISLQVIDVMIYNKHLEAKLRKLIEKLRVESWEESRMRLQVYKSPLRLANDSRFEQTLELQSLLMDYFQLIARYNPFLSSYSGLCIFIWTSILVVLYFFTFWAMDVELKLEWYLMEAQTCSVFLTIAAMMSLVRRSSRQLYPLITSLTALDDERSSSKLRWLSILNFYFPKCRYCFHINKTEISWLFSCKIIGWSLSGAVLVSNLISFYVAGRSMTSVGLSPARIGMF